MKKSSEKYPPVSAAIRSDKLEKSPTSQQLNTEKNNEANKVRCSVCFKEVAPNRLCSGHGAGSSPSDDADKSAEEKATVEGTQSPRNSSQSATSAELADKVAANSNSKKPNSKSGFSPEVVAELSAKRQLLVNHDRKSLVLTMKMFFEPTGLTEKQQEAVRESMEIIIKECRAFQKENNLPDSCIKIIRDKDGNLLSFGIKMPTFELYDGLIQRLANNLVPQSTTSRRKECG